MIRNAHFAVYLGMINQFQEHVYLYFYTHVNISHSISFIYDGDLYYLPYHQILS